MNTILAINSIIVAGFMLVGIVVALKNSKSPLHRLFLGFTTTASAWVMANYYSNNFDISYQNALLANHITLFMPGVVLLFLLGFVLLINSGKISKLWYLYGLFSFVVYSLTLTSIAFTSIHKQGNVYAIDFTNFANFYFLTLIANMIVVMMVIIRSRKKSKSLQRQSLC